MATPGPIKIRVFTEQQPGAFLLASKPPLRTEIGIGAKARRFCNFPRSGRI